MVRSLLSRPPFSTKAENDAAIPLSILPDDVSTGTWNGIGTSTFRQLATPQLTPQEREGSWQKDLMNTCCAILAHQSVKLWTLRNLYSHMFIFQFDFEFPVIPLLSIYDMFDCQVLDNKTMYGLDVLLRIGMFNGSLRTQETPTDSLKESHGPIALLSLPIPEEIHY